MIGKLVHGFTRAVGWISLPTGMLCAGSAVGSAGHAARKMKEAEALDVIVASGTDIRIQDGSFGTTWAGGFSEDVIVSANVGQVEKNVELVYGDSFLPADPSGMSSVDILSTVSSGLKESAQSSMDLATGAMGVFAVAFCVWAAAGAATLVLNKVRLGYWDGYGY